MSFFRSIRLRLVGRLQGIGNYVCQHVSKILRHDEAHAHSGCHPDCRLARTVDDRGAKAQINDIHALPGLQYEVAELNRQSVGLNRPSSFANNEYLSALSLGHSQSSLQELNRQYSQAFSALVKEGS